MKKAVSFAFVLLTLFLSSYGMASTQPLILSASISPQKVRPGDIMLITAEAKWYKNYSF